MAKLCCWLGPVKGATKSVVQPSVGFSVRIGGSSFPGCRTGLVTSLSVTHDLMASAALRENNRVLHGSRIILPHTLYKAPSTLRLPHHTEVRDI